MNTCRMWQTYTISLDRKSGVHYRLCVHFSRYDSVHDHSQLWRASVSKITTQRSLTASHLLKNEENYMEGQTKIELQK